MRWTEPWRASAASLRRGLGRITDPFILLPSFGVMLLALMWGMTYTLVEVEHTNAARAAMVSSLELVETYEAQVVRALREIDQTLKFVKYAYERGGGKLALSALKERALLPPDLLFAVVIANADGKVVASTRASSRTDIAGEDHFEESRLSEALSVGHPRRGRYATEWTLDFSRRLDAADGSFAGVVTISVDAAYFVSGYERSKLGDHGFLGILGTDGVFRVRRSGELVSAGDVVDYASANPSETADGASVLLTTNPWDGVERYTIVRQLYDFPLAVIVGLSEDEQHPAVHKNLRAYFMWAAGGSIVVILFVVVLGRMSWHLSRSRKRESAARVAYAERVEYLAYHDGLTGLPNRSLFTKLLDQGIGQARRHDRSLALLFLDLDRFKSINDTLGHEAGDQVLQEVARRLTACLRSSDIVARLGGDEFVALMLEVTELRHAATVAQNMLAAIATPFTLMGQELRVTASIGIAVYPQDGQDEQTLTKNADVAMYQAKLEGKNNFQFYSESLNTNSVERIALEASLRHALWRDEFRLHYQAKRDRGGERIIGMEALVRWQHPDLGTIPPLGFIPIAEETGLMVPIGNWAIRTACMQSVAWQARGFLHSTMSINLTARQFIDENLLRDLAAILEETGIERGRLELEISETMLIHNVERALETLERIKELGIRIAIDDFGVGYSTLAAVQRFPIDTIKIDRSFVRRISSDAVDPHLTDAVVNMARMLSLSVVALGVETKEQAEFLREHGCDEFQGFYFDKPAPPEEFEELLRAQSVADRLWVDVA